MSTKKEQVAQYLADAAVGAEPGDWLASVDSLQELMECSIGSATAGVKLAQSRGVRLERRRGKHGGYFLAAVPDASPVQAPEATEPGADSWREEALTAVGTAVAALEQLRDVLQRGGACGEPWRTA